MARRDSLLNLSPADRQQLAQLLFQYINDQVLFVHSSGHDWHHPGSPRFFLGHREYLGSFESFLLRSGNARFVPLPAWDPATTIPQEFSTVKPSDTGISRPALTGLSPGLPKPAGLQAGNVCGISSIEDLSTSTQPWHNQVHGLVGGTMANPNISPAALIFWPWHAYIDDIYDDWLSCSMDAAGDPAGYAGGGTARVVYRGTDNQLHELSVSDQWHHFDMTGVPGAVEPAGDPMGYSDPVVPRVVYRGVDNHLHELAIYPATGSWGDFDMTGVPGAVEPAGDPMGYVGGGTARVVYRGVDNHLHELWLGDQWYHFDMSIGTLRD
jgi:Common central domain of tyrosinase